MAKANRVKAAPQPDEAAVAVIDDVEAGLNPDAIFDAAAATAAVDTGVDAVAMKPAEVIPKIESVEWTSFVMSKLLDDEIFDGCPTVEGLRRVCQEYVGDVVGSVSVVNQTPTAANGNHSCVTHDLTVDCHYHGPYRDNKTRRFSGVADVFQGNGSDKDGAFSWRFSSATCETRAESRAYRRLMRLRHIVTAEELTPVPPEDSGASGYITKQQLTVLNTLCHRCDIDGLKFMMGFKKNHGIKDSWGGIDKVPYGVAQRMVAALSELQRAPGKVPADIIGYKADWLGKVE